MSRRRPGGAPLVVLLSVPPPRKTTNPYVIMLAEALRSTAGIEVHSFDWRFALLGRYDVFHVHWPENLVRGRGRMRTFARHGLATALLGRLWVSGTPVVRTLHNIAPHERASRPSRLILRALDHLTVATISLNPLTPPLPGVPNHQIPHGHYKEWFAPFARRPAQRGRMVSFGAVRPYKNLPALVSALRSMPQTELRLTIAGSCPDSQVGSELVARADGDDRIELLLEHQPDDRLVSLITASELVVLPYRELHNSGAALAALSLGRPVLVPSNDVTEALAEEVGPFWVRRYHGDLTADALRTALLGPPAGDVAPDLTQRDWRLAGPEHHTVYLDAVAASGGRRDV